MKLNTKPLLENLKETGKGVMPLVNVQEDLYFKKAFNVNSWFAIGHFEAQGHKLDYLFHLMVYHLPNQPALLNSCFSITDETTGWYCGEDKMIPLSEGEISESQFDIKTPHGRMWGDLNRINIQAAMPSGEINVTLAPVGYALYNGGTGYFPLLGMNVYQYSIPRLITNGTLTIEGRSYDVNGFSWFDRQWEMKNGDLMGRWSWMDLNLDCGDVISLWGSVDAARGEETAWATILHPDGTQTVTVVEPLSRGESDYWESKKSGRKYPTHWVVKIPAFDACLEVTPFPREQEIVSEFPMLHKYEGASSVKGIYKGTEITGYCYVELVARWYNY